MDTTRRVTDAAAMTEQEAEIWEVVRTANRAWVDGRPRDTVAMFDPRVVAVAPGFDRRLEGRDAMVQSFVDYVDHVDTHEFTEHDPHVDVFGDVAVVTYAFTITFTPKGGETMNEEGREVVVFQRAGGRWQAVWRTQIPQG